MAKLAGWQWVLDNFLPQSTAVGLVNAVQAAQADAAQSAIDVAAATQAAFLTQDEGVAALIDTAAGPKTQAALDGRYAPVGPDLAAKLVTPFYIAHRNAPLRFPEESIEGQRAMAEAGFPIEVDVQALADGTLVACHDATVDRTMTGIDAGNVDTKTPAQWRTARIKPAIAGGKDGTPVFFEDWLDEFGGRYLLSPELKYEAVLGGHKQAFIDAIVSRGLGRAVLAQSFQFGVASDFAAAGINAIYLTGAAPAQTPAEIAAAGIWGVSGGPSMTAGTISALKAEGLKVVIYTCNTPSEAATAISRGADGVFSDDPQYVSGMIRARETDSFASGHKSPGMRFNTFTDARLAGPSLVFPATTGVVTPYVELREFGLINAPFRLSIDIEFEVGGSSPNQGSSFGLVLWKNTVNPNDVWVDGARTGQEAITCIARRNGQMAAWKYVGGSGAASIGSTAAMTGAAQFAEAGNPGFTTFTLTVTGTKIEMTAPHFGYAITVADSWAETGLRLGIRGSGLSAGRVRNVVLERL